MKPSSPPVKPFFEELLLYSGQFGLFYIIMQVIIEGTAYVSNPGHVALFITLVIQAALLAVKGRSLPWRLLGSFLVPAVYSSIEFTEGRTYFLNAAHVGFWIYPVLSSLFMVMKAKKSTAAARLADTGLVIVNIFIFIFLYFYFDTWKEVARPEQLTIQNIFGYTEAFLADPTHWFVISGGVLLAVTVALGRYEIAGLKDRLFVLFGQYVDENIRDTIMQKGTAASRRMKLAVLFADLRDFTSLCEANNPQSVTEMLNAYFEAWDTVVKQHNGIIDKYIGDAVMILFGLGDPASACNGAVACSLAMNGAYETLAETLKKRGLPVPAGYGIGCHFGDVILGDIGSRHRKNFTIIGDTANIASRLEGATRKLNRRILISSEVYDRLDPLLQEQFMGVGRLDLKGKTRAVEAWGTSGGL